MTRRRMLMLLIATVVGVAGCTSHAGQAATPPTAPPTATSADATIHPADVVSTLRQHGFTVTGVHPADVTAMFALEQDQATIDGTSSFIATFGNTTGRQAWLELLAGLGRAGVVGTGTTRGDLWGVNPTKEQGGLQLAARIAAALGGHTTVGA
jgi:hypothetical protein